MTKDTNGQDPGSTNSQNTGSEAPGNEATVSYINQREEILSMLKKGAAFTEQLLRENERLRFRVAELETTSNNGPADQSAFVNQLMDRIQQLEHEKEEMVNRFQEVQAENQNFAERYVEIEEENNNLANLYVASYQLHSTLDFDEVIQIINEIVINLIGAEAFSIALVDSKSELVKAVSHEGFDADQLAPMRIGEGIIGKVLASGDSYVVETIDPTAAIVPGSPLVSVPLKIKDTVFGVLCIYKFLQQKTTIENVDHELFTLLAGHAATAIFSSRLYTDSTRKLQTLQGLINLMAS